LYENFEILFTKKKKKAVINGIELCYFDEGEGLPILMVHGWPQHSFCWHKLAEEMVSEYRTIAIDLRGCGDSEIVDDGFDKKTLATDIAGLVNNLGIERIVVLGHDWGAPIAYRFAFDYAERVIALVIMNGRLPLLDRHLDLMYTPQQVRERWYFNFNLVPGLPEKMISLSLKDFLSYLFRHWSGGKLVHEPEEINEYIRVHARPDGLKAGLGFYRAAVGKDIEDWNSLKGQILNMPNLVLWGALDPVLPAIYTQGLEKVTPDIEIHINENLGHFLQEEAPDWCADQIRKFLKSRFGYLA
jgi:pimeloyl-ACP methyl ester carboxylesterase